MEEFIIFLDCKGHPPEKPGMESKNYGGYTWRPWFFLAKAYGMTGNIQCLNWFEKVHDYTWHHFKDPDFPGVVLGIWIDMERCSYP